MPLTVYSKCYAYRYHAVGTCNRLTCAYCSPQFLPFPPFTILQASNVRKIITHPAFISQLRIIGRTRRYKNELFYMVTCPK